MALYAIGDLHLCLGAPKPMDVFGGAWTGYMEKLKEGMSVIGPEDTTVLLGDLSWALDLAEAGADFSWIDQIPGRKIILKGNHDYWWSTAKKFYDFCKAQGFSNQFILNNNHYEYEGWAICGTRGWFYEESRSGQHDEKVFKREGDSGSSGKVSGSPLLLWASSRRKPQFGPGRPLGGNRIPAGFR